MADRPFATSFKQPPSTDEPGLVLGDDNIVYLIKPDGSRVEVGGGGALGALLLESSVVSEKLTDLDAVTDVQDADEFVLARSGGNNKIDGASLKGAVEFNGGTVTSAISIDPSVDAGGVPDLSISSAHPALNYDEVIAIGSNAGVIWELDSDGSVFQTMREDGSRFVVVRAGTPAFVVYNNAGTSQVGFFDKAATTGAAQPTVTGVKLPSDTVMASLLAALVALGLVTDSTT